MKTINFFFYLMCFIIFLTGFITYPNEIKDKTVFAGVSQTIGEAVSDVANIVMYAFYDFGYKIGGVVPFNQQIGILISRSIPFIIILWMLWKAIKWLKDFKNINLLGFLSRG